MAHTLPTEYIRNCNSGGNGTLYCFGKWAESVTGGAFWIFSLIGFCVAIYLATSGLGSRRAYGFASFVGLLGAVWFAILQFISWWIAAAFILNGIIGLAVLIMKEK